MKKWRCRVCGYVHEGPTPPDKCPVCGAPASEFEEVAQEGTTGGSAGGPTAELNAEATSKVPRAKAVSQAAPVTPVAPVTPMTPANPVAPVAPVAPLAPEEGDLKRALSLISYGLYVVASKTGDRINGQVCNTFVQVTGDPPRVAVGLNHKNLTHDFVKESGAFAVTVLGRGNYGLVRQFGFQSGRQVDKFQGVRYIPGPITGCPVLADGVAYLECRVRPEMSVDVGTHALFVADVVGAGVIKDVLPLTYADYRRNRARADADDLDTQDVIAALNLEYGANRRYEAQLKDLAFSDLVKVLEGVMRTEGDHVRDAVRYLLKKVPYDSGLARALLYMKMNLEFEENARDTYLSFAREVSDAGLQEMFKAQARAEMGHVNIFKRFIEDMESGEFPIVVFCPVCGWEVDFGEGAKVGQEAVCQRCGVRLRLDIENGSFVPVRVS